MDAMNLGERIEYRVLQCENSVRNTPYTLYTSIPYIYMYICMCMHK
jgi:hypothetical protein